MKETKKVRITVDLTKPLYDRLERLEATVGATSKADVVREALRLYEFFVKKSSEGNEFLMRRKDDDKGEQTLLALFATE